MLRKSWVLVKSNKGAKTARTTWRGGLWVLAALAGFIAFVAIFYIPSDGYSVADKRIDWVGAALITVGLIFLQFVISDAPGASEGWKTPCELEQSLYVIFTSLMPQTS
jgi:hypothetical protein